MYKEQNNITSQPEVERGDSLVANLLSLKKGEVLRLTTAKEGRNVSGVYDLLKRKYGRKLKLRGDGDDILAWTVIHYKKHETNKNTNRSTS